MVATAARARLVVAAAVALGVVAALVLVTRPGPRHSAPTIAAPPSVASAVGPGQPLHARVGNWRHSPTSYAYQWQACPTTHGACTDIPRATGASYTPMLIDHPRAYRVRVIARNRYGQTAVLSAPSLVPPASPGAPGPAVSCTRTLAAGADLQTALSGAVPGQVICLDAGDWGDVTLSRVAPAGNVTLAAAPGQVVHLRSVTIEGQSNTPSATDNLTIRGFRIDRGVQDLTDTTGGLVFAHDTITHVGRGYGFYFNPDGNGGSHAQSGVVMRDNRISQVGECLGIIGGDVHRFRFSHNVCGPGIGYGDSASTQPSHYIEVGRIDGLSITGNAFLGPADPGADRADLHLNVFHLFGGGRDIDFSHNLLWHTQARGQAILIQEGQFDRIRIDDNLDVEDPACGQHSGCANYMIEMADAHGLSFQHNTVVGAAYGVLLTNSDESGDYPAGSSYEIAHNVIVGASGSPAISYGGCSTSCVFDDNVTGDGSAAKAGALHSVTYWAPAWRSGSYEAAGLPFPVGFSGILPAR